jgi:hypothetical protein
MGARAIGRRGRRLGAVLAATVGLLGLGLVLAPAGEGLTTGHPPLRYVALGDSFTSGPLILPHDTTWVPQDCGQSYTNYPHLVAQALGATSFTDVSCGGATIDDLYRSQHGLFLDGSNAPQLGAVGHDTDIVTIGMGGNDVGFVGVATGCIRLLGPPLEAPCTPKGAGTPADPVSKDIRETGPELGSALDAIHRQAPHARVFVVGYPTALPDDAVACWPYVPILQQDLPWIVARYKEMNAMLAAAAAAHDATYVDTYTPSIGHDACRLPTQAWLNAAVLVPPSFPAHPNQLGEIETARAVTATIQRVLAASGHERG